MASRLEQYSVTSAQSGSQPDEQKAYQMELQEILQTIGKTRVSLIEDGRASALRESLRSH